MEPSCHCPSGFSMANRVCHMAVDVVQSLVPIGNMTKYLGMRDQSFIEFVGNDDINFRMGGDSLADISKALCGLELEQFSRVPICVVNPNVPCWIVSIVCQDRSVAVREMTVV